MKLWYIWCNYFGNVPLRYYIFGVWLSQGSVATLIMWGGWRSYSQPFISKSNGEKGIKIRWFLTKLQTKISWLLFMAHGVDGPLQDIASTRSPSHTTLFHHGTSVIANASTYLNIRQKCMPIILYGLDFCWLSKRNSQSLDFTVNRVLMKLFKTSNIINDCRDMFHITLPSVQCHSASMPLWPSAHSWRSLLWPPYVIGQAIICLPCGFFLLSFFSFPRLILAVADRMSTILPHMVWP